MKNALRMLLCNLLLNCIINCCTAQNPFNGKKIQYQPLQDSIRISYNGNIGGQIGVWMPEYTYRKTVFEIREGRTCLVEKAELAKQLLFTQDELRIHIQRDIVPIVVKERPETILIPSIRYRERTNFIIEGMNRRVTMDNTLRNLQYRVVFLEKEADRRKYKPVKGFGYGFVTGALITIGAVIATMR